MTGAAKVGAAGVAVPEKDGLESLLTFARTLFGADFAVAFEADEAGRAVPLAANPPPLPPPFAWGFDGDEGWAAGPLKASAVALPSSLLLALPQPVGEVLFISTPTDEARRSGVLMLWGLNRAPACECPYRAGMEDGAGLLRPIFARLLRERRMVLHRRLLAERFHDLVESVPLGIAVLDGDGHSGLLNARAAALLGLPAGDVAAAELAGPMRDLRVHCRNAADLDLTYRPLQSDADYSVTAVWDLGERQIEVDTHPIRGDGRNGRIWLFHDVTAQHVVERTLRQMATTDALTGLGNRRYFMEAGAAALTKAAEGGLAVLMLDIDHFKAINDQHGHGVGDEVLQAVAARCRTALRDHDVIARLGGEEFAVLLGILSHADAAVVGERLRAAVSTHPVRTTAGLIEVRLSIGGAMFADAGETLAGLLERADQMLYRAKRLGRDRVCIEQPRPQPA
ncbi:MAG TPA: GGDEF domain-containing protein [Xanthobacteraceae bacterium]|nr:GGDEF domain-containing protein [Xanthobacteraceae bacterium]